MILGGPGAGKTTRLIAEVEQYLQQGVDPARIAFVSYTKAAANEARERAQAAFSLREKDLPYFRTVHSLCFRELGLRRADVLGPADWRELSTLLGVQFTGHTAGPGELPGETRNLGDQCIGLIDYARATQQPLEDVHSQMGGDVSWWRLRQIRDTLDQYKADTGKLDFGDMLAMYLRSGATVGVDVAVIDEAQDSTTVQWNVLRAAFRTAREVLIAGDDDQAIHAWAGADIRHFLRIRAQREVLPVSHRLSQQVWDVGARIAGRIVERIPKDWGPAAHTGTVTTAAGIEHVQIDPAAGTWMLLVRSRFQEAEFERVLRERGLLYRTRFGPSVRAGHRTSILAWERIRRGAPVSVAEQKAALEYTTAAEVVDRPWYDVFDTLDRRDRDYYRAVLRNGYKLDQQPTIYIGTIHSVKGAEADHVVLATDLTAAILRGYELDADNEHRVFYVGATRARSSLTLLQPTTQHAYRV